MLDLFVEDYLFSAVFLIVGAFKKRHRLALYSIAAADVSVVAFYNLQIMDYLLLYTAVVYFVVASFLLAKNGVNRLHGAICTFCLFVYFLMAYELESANAGYFFYDNSGAFMNVAFILHLLVSSDLNFQRSSAHNNWMDGIHSWASDWGAHYEGKK